MKISAQQPSRRLFFALWPDDTTRTQLSTSVQNVIKNIEGKKVPNQNLHLTLRFLGSVDSLVQNQLELFADTLDFRPCQLLLNNIAFWPKSKVLFLTCADTCETLNKFVNEMNRGLQECGITQRSDKPFIPHVTLIRKAATVPDNIAIEPVLWQADKFVLVESKTRTPHANYTVLKQW